MTPEKFQGLVARISYKPGWAIDAFYDREAACVTLRVAFTVPDATQQRVQPLPLRIKHPISEQEIRLMNEAALILFVEQKIREMEDHEFREWFKLDGVPVSYPHGPDGELV